jgi:hypothetical protein
MKRVGQLVVSVLVIALTSQSAFATICYAIPTPKVRALCGWVTDPSCQTVIGAQVIVSKAANGKNQVVATVKTDVSGYFEVSGLKRGTYVVEISAAGFRSYSHAVRIVSLWRRPSKKLRFLLTLCGGCPGVRCMTEKEFEECQKQGSG